MRNQQSDNFGYEITEEYRKSGLTIDKFIDLYSKKHNLIQIEYLGDPETYGKKTDRYASFIRLIKEPSAGETMFSQQSILSCYYWESEDAWFCKW